MRIGVASDSHGDLDALGRALDHLAREKVDRIFFLGGMLADLEAVLARRRREHAAPALGSDAEFLDAVRGALARPGGTDPLEGRVARVASRACPAYASGPDARKQVDLVEGRICCLVHDKAELTREDIANASLLFHGNTARAALVQIGPRCFVTPGRLRPASPGGEPATFAVLEATPRELVLVVRSVAGAELRRDRVVLAPGGNKMSVR